MRKIFRVLSAVTLVMILASAGYSQYSYFTEYLEFNSVGGGARASGMGGAGLALSSDEMSFSWNPAGMIFAAKPSIGLQFLSRADKFTTVDAVAIDTTVVYGPVEVKRSGTDLGYGGFVVPFTFLERRWSAGGGYKTVYDMKFEYDGPGLFDSHNSFTQRDGVDALSLALSAPITDNLGFGVTANTYIRGTESNILFGNGYIYQLQGNPYPDTVDFSINDNSHYSGVNFDIGLLGKFGIASGSIVIRTPYSLVQKTKLAQNIMILPRPVGVIDRITYTTHMPFGYSLGLAATPRENMTLAVDFDSKSMSDVDIDVNYESYYYQDHTINPEWKDLNQLRIGAEYLFDAGFAKVPLRIGFYNIPSVSRELDTLSIVEVDSVLNFRSTYGSQANTNVITFGTGLHFARGWVDLGYQFGSSSFTTIVAYRNTGDRIKQKSDYSRLIVSAGMFF